MTSDGSGLHLVLLGKTGVGKSAVGNSILGREAFFSGADTVSVTSDITIQSTVINGRSITVMDTPGLADTGSSSEEAEVRRSVAGMEQVMKASPDGVDAFLLVVRFGARFTAEDNKCVQLLRAELGQEMLRNHCVLVVTCGDLFQIQIGQTGVSFDEWVSKQKGAFQELVTECSGRKVLFDNTTTDDNIKSKQIRVLLEQVDSLKSVVEQSALYTAANFAMTAVDRTKLIVAAEEPRISSETMTKVNGISDELCKISAMDLASQMPALQSLLSRCQQLESNLQTLDKGTGALTNAMSLVTSKTATVRNTIKAAEDKKRREQEQARLKREAEEEMERLRRETEAMERRAAEARRAEAERQRQEEERRRRERQREEQASRERQAALEAELERQRLDAARQGEALRAALCQRRSSNDDCRIL